MGRILLLALTALVVCASPAAAATVRLVTERDEVPVADPYARGDDVFRYSTVRFAAGRAERNRVTVRLVRGRLRFHDRGAHVRPGRGCRAAGRHAVVCRRNRNLRIVRVVLHDGADRLSVSRRVRTRVIAQGGTGHDVLNAGGGSAALLGGLGNDRLAGGPGDDTLGGAGGDDRLYGRRGRDVVDGGPGADRQLGGPGNDTLDVGGRASSDTDRADGGPGRDTASYANRLSGVAVTTQGGGRAGESDVFRSIENLEGTSGSDVLLGDDGPNRLDGRVGGSDRIEAGEGDDLIVKPYLNNGETLDANCGAGSDRIDTYYGGSALLARRECERVRFAQAVPDIDPRPSPPTGRVFRMYLRCGTAAERLVVRTAAKPRPWLPTGPFGVEVARAPAANGPPGTLCPIDFTLSDEGLALLDARGELPVELAVGGYEMISVVLTRS